MSEEKRIFLEESYDLLTNLENRLAIINNDINNKENIIECLRILHTLKGSSAIMGFAKLEKIFHSLEGKLEYLKDNPIKDNIKKFYNISLIALDSILNYLKLYEQDRSLDEQELSSIISKLDDFTLENKNAHDKENENEDLKKIDSLLQEIQLINLNEIGKDKKAHYFFIWIRLKDQVVLKSTRAYLIIKQLTGKNEKTGKLVISTPPIKDIISGDFDHDFSIIVESKNSIRKFEELISNFLDIEENKLIEISKEQVIKNVKEYYNLIKPKSVKENEGNVNLIDNVIRITVNDINEIINITGELSAKINLALKGSIDSQVKNGADETLYSNIDYLLWRLRNLTVNLKLLPISKVLNRIPRAVQKIASEEGKQVNIQLDYANNIKIDRELIQPLFEILLQLIKNSISHGIESAYERIAKNKDPEGNILLKAGVRKDALEITIIDDGQGIQIDKVVNIALERGLVTSRDIENLSNDELYELIFLPGLSTAEKINMISGRGIGLDLVKKRIVSLGGEIQVQSNRGTGTIFSIYLPMTFSLIKILNVRIGGQYYSIPINEIYHIDQINRNEIITEKGQEYIIYEDYKWKLVNIRSPKYSPNKSFDVEKWQHYRRNSLQEFPIKGDSLEIFNLPILNNKLNICFLLKLNKRYGLIVDEFGDQGVITIKNIGDNRNPHNFRKGAILNNGEVSLILSISELENIKH